jgi:hypothetical protein
MVKSLAIACALVACQGKGGDTHDASIVGSAVRSPGSANVGFGKRNAGSDAGADDPDKAQPKPDDPTDTVDPGKAIAELGAIPAWQAVIDRAQLLGRRKQHGVAYGKVGPPIMMTAPVLEPSPNAGVHVDAGLVPSPYVWLVDDTEGNGSLGIRVKFPAKAPKEGDRVALGGAWELDDAHAWYWKVDTVTALSPAPPSDLKIKASPPGHVISEGYFPPGVKKISLAKDNDIVYFQVVGPPPAVDGDGWPVADELGNPVVALLNLPGERPAYGGLDMRAPDERWPALKRAQTYWVKIGVVHRHGADKPAVMNARTPPVWIR